MARVDHLELHALRSAKALGIVPRSVNTTTIDYRASGADGLPPIRAGAWAVWALRQTAGTVIPSSDFECDLPDGRTGVVAAIFDRGEWRLVCRAA